MLSSILMLAMQATAPLGDPYLGNLQSVWTSCLIDHTRRFATQPESAADVVTAAIGSCATDERAYFTYMENILRRDYRGLPGLEQRFADNRTEMRRIMTGQMMAEVMERRAATPAPAPH